MARGPILALLSELEADGRPSRLRALAWRVHVAAGRVWEAAFRLKG